MITYAILGGSVFSVQHIIAQNLILIGKAPMSVLQA